MVSLTLVPLSVNIALYVLFFRYGSNYFDSVITSWLSHMAQALPAWMVTLSKWGFKLLAWVMLATAAAISFTFISGLVSAPFNDHLSRAALRSRLKALGRSDAFSRSEQNLLITIKLEAKRMVILVLGALLAFLIGLIPLLQIPALVLGAWLVAFEYFGYPISQRSTKLAPVALFTLRHPAVSLGFGCFLLLIMALPFTSIVYIPLAVVAGTVLYADLTTSSAGTRKRT